MAMTIQGYALFLLNRKDYSEQELRKKLLLREYPPDKIEQLIADFKAKSYIDDSRIIKNSTRRFIFKAKGNYHTQSHLKSRGIDVSSQDISELVETFKDEEGLSLEEQYFFWLEKKWRTINKKDIPYIKKKEKLFHSAITRGISSSLIKNFLSQKSTEQDEKEEYGDDPQFDLFDHDSI